MSKTYVIQWKSKVNGRAGKGTKLFELEEAEALAAELNQEYPEIEHGVAGETAQTPENRQPDGEAAVESQSESNQEPAATPTKVLSLAG